MLAGGVPYVFWNFGMQMFTPSRTRSMLYMHDQEVRRVRLNQAHPAHVTPSWYGSDSVGHYEDDTLLMNTTGVKKGPYAMLDMYGTPYSAALHVIERYRLLDYPGSQSGYRPGSRKSTPRYPRGLNDRV